MAIRRFEEIEGWSLGHKVARAVVFTMHNAAEGFDAGSNAEFTKFLRYAQRRILNHERRTKNQEQIS